VADGGLHDAHATAVNDVIREANGGRTTSSRTIAVICTDLECDARAG
jgi:hypothetical protein